MDICTPKVSSTKQEFLSFLCNASIWSRSRVWDWWFYAKHKLSQLLNYTITSPAFHTIGPNNKQPKWDIDHVGRRRRGCCGISAWADTSVEVRGMWGSTTELQLPQAVPAGSIMPVITWEGQHCWKYFTYMETENNLFYFIREQPFLIPSQISASSPPSTP